MSTVLPSRTTFRLFVVAVAVAVAVRVTVLAVAAPPFQADPDAYKAIAETLAATGVFGLGGETGTPRPIAFRPPLYPWIVSWTVSGNQAGVHRVSISAVGCLHVIFAAVTAGLIYLTTLRLIRRCVGCMTFSARDHAAAVAAAMLFSADPILVKQSTEVMTETLAAMLTTAALWIWVALQGNQAEPTGREGPGLKVGDWLLPSAALGAALALAYLCRPTFLVWAILLIAARAIPSGSGNSFSRSLKAALVVALIVGATVAGWTLRNWKQFGHPIWATTHGGYTLLLANNESFYRYLREGNWGEAWDASDFLAAYPHRYQGDPRTAEFWNQQWKGDPVYDDVTQFEDDRLCYESAVATMKRQPSMFVWSSIVRVGRLWSPWPHDIAGRSRLAVVVVGGFYVLIYLAIAVAFYRHGRTLLAKPWWPVLLLALTLSAVHAFYWSNLRMRAPLMPALAVMAVFAAVDPRSSRHPVEVTNSEDEPQG